MDTIVIKGARVHNLKNIDLTLPRNKFIVITGLSGSGKSSLAFDTIYAEGQRRYVESLSAYARQFLGQMDKPDVDFIEGLSPAISIDQKTTSKNPRSTVGTVTEIHDYLRLLYARIGIPHCPVCGRVVEKQTIDQMVDRLLALPERTKLVIMAPIVRGRKGEFVKTFEDIRRQGFARVRVDGILYDLAEEIKLEKNKKHNIDVVVDRLVVKDGIKTRLTDSLETALKLAEGLALVEIVDGEEITFSENFACPHCEISLPEISPRLFSFNNPFGACPECTGLGYKLEVDPDLVIPNKDLTLRQGAIAAWNAGNTGSYYFQVLEALAQKYGFSVDVPVKDLDPEILRKILYGLPGEKVRVKYYNYTSGSSYTFDANWEGVIPNLERRYRETQSEAMREEIEKFMTQRKCPACQGARLKKEALAVTVGGKNIHELGEMTVEKLLAFIENLELTERELLIARQVLKEIKERLGFLNNVGLDYLTLNRSATTLSGGEAQRIRLATQIGSGLTGVLYVLDEPSIGLHPRDTQRLLDTLKRLRDLGNTLVVVEHDEETIRAADYIVDMGPGAGEKGGQVVAAGSFREILNHPDSITAKYLRGEEKIPVPPLRRKGNGKALTIVGARENNLKNLTVKIPLGKFVAVTGVSGSGKSTLINEILYKAVAGKFYKLKEKPGAYEKILGLTYIDKIINIDQSPIGRTPRSNPATYTGVFNDIRELFAATPEARMRGYKPGRFSFNVRGGRCEACQGDGIIKIEMHFLPDVYVPCEVCKGARYNRETLEVRYKGKNIAEVLDMTVEEALEFFAAIPKIQRKLQTLFDVGLGYIRLGQPATTLSGGEAQRVKLATELARRSTGKTLYILDEPTTGLHIADVHRLLDVLNRLVEAGNTVVVIEHNLDVIKTADHIIDLGPEGGDKGGQIIAEGTPEEVAQNPASYTGKFLRPYLNLEVNLEVGD
ncbi:excinuclease ABC subunit UvrA [Carboxydothermus pertinax]|uniref:UvrABC system protein A n=1 Tax=Carboxydothermus pertinax TaxID=870242 RepID=A0A1L8CRI3_9THEO|nr:excinuclease ABC subunit UvrA [Carboxydothermus pertinax]GAV21531.1 excinuclease ABC, A subunit [Carboxydothermus pertinax]